MRRFAALACILSLAGCAEREQVVSQWLLDHPAWTTEECNWIYDGYTWVGMDEDQLKVALRYRARRNPSRNEAQRIERDDAIVYHSELRGGDWIVDRKTGRLSSWSTKTGGKPLPRSEASWAALRAAHADWNDADWARLRKGFVWHDMPRAQFDFFRGEHWPGYPWLESEAGAVTEVRNRANGDVFRFGQDGRLFDWVAQRPLELGDLER